MTGAGITIAPLEKEGKKLGIHTGLTNRNFTGTNFRDLKAQPGLLISADGKCQPWKIEGVVEEEGELILYGPWISGELIKEKDLTPEMILTLVKAFRILIQEEFPLSHFSPQELLTTEEGDLLFFPPKLMNFLSTRQTVQQTLENREVYNYPGLRKEKALSFSLGVISYNALAGQLPFIGKDIAETHDMMRDSNFIPIEKRVAGLKPMLSKQVNHALAPIDEKMPSLTQWEETVSEWIKVGAVDEITMEEKELHEQNLFKLEKKVSRSYKRRHFIDTNRGPIVRNTVIGIVILLIISGLAGAFLKPPKNKGMDPEQVVRAFYQGISDVDPLMVSDCLASSALQIDAEAVKMTFLLGKQKQKQFGNPGIFPAKRWEEEGYPELPPFTTVFGVTNLEILEQNGMEFKVRYNRWYTAHDPDNTEIDANKETVTHTGLKITDRLILEQHRKVFKIVHIEREEEVFYEKEVLWEVMY